MKRIVLFLLATSTIYLTSCETTKEVTLRSDGTGILTTTSDMGSLIGMMKMAGEGKELDQLKDEKPVDTTVTMDKMADNISSLSPEEKELVKKGTLGINMDIKNEKFITQMTFPFSNPKEIAIIDKMYSRIITEALMKQLDSSKADTPAGLPAGLSPEANVSIDDYYNLNISKGVIERKFLADKYAGMANDDKMKAAKEMAGMGLGNSKMILYLPSPVKKAEGKTVTVSEDKKKVTIMSSMEDFFDDGKSLEFRIEY